MMTEAFGLKSDDDNDVDGNYYKNEEENDDKEKGVFI